LSLRWTLLPVLAVHLAESGALHNLDALKNPDRICHFVQSTDPFQRAVIKTHGTSHAYVPLGAHPQEYTNDFPVLFPYFKALLSR
jgi:hypothetical protein